MLLHYNKHSGGFEAIYLKQPPTVILTEKQLERKNVYKGLEQGSVHSEQVRPTWKVIFSDGSDSETNINDLEQTDSALCQLVSSGSGSNNTSTAASNAFGKVGPRCKKYEGGTVSNIKLTYSGVKAPRPSKQTNSFQNK